MRQSFQILLACLLVLVSARSSHAAINDFTLERFHKGVERSPWANGDCIDEDCILNVNADNELFKGFARELGMVMSPKYLAPAESLGLAGFAVGLEASFSTIDNQKEHWKKASPDQGKTTAQTLSTMQIHVRKGLPFSFELGGTMTKLFESDIIALGAELKWAFNEGFYYLPDIAVRGSVNRLLGSRDLDMLTGGVDVSISHPFGIGGMLSLTPYIGWNLLFISASSHVLDATPGLPGFTPPYCEHLDGTDERKPDASGGFRESAECVKATRAANTADYRGNFVLSRQRLAIHRGFGGVRIKVTRVSFVAEAALAEEVQTYSLRMAMDF